MLPISWAELRRIKLNIDVFISGDQDGILQPRHELADSRDRVRDHRCGRLWGLPLVGKAVTVALPADSDQEGGQGRAGELE